MQRLIGIAALAALTGAAGCASLKDVASDPFLMSEAIVQSDPGIWIYVRNKRVAWNKTFAAEKTVLFVHGATYPSESGFDLRLDGVSWMDDLAWAGYDVWLVDVRGYGRSTRPPAMDQPPNANPPFATTEEAVRDVGAAVDYILQARGIQRLNLIGWSWGTVTMAWYTSLNNAKVEKLVLYAPVWIRQTPSLVQTGPGPLAAYRTVQMSAARAPVADRRGAGEAAGPDPAGLVRGMGRRDAGERSRRQGANPIGRARTERRRARRPALLGRARR